MNTRTLGEWCILYKYADILLLSFTCMYIEQGTVGRLQLHRHFRWRNDVVNTFFSDIFSSRILSTRCGILWFLLSTRFHIFLLWDDFSLESCILPIEKIKFSIFLFCLFKSLSRLAKYLAKKCELIYIRYSCLYFLSFALVARQKNIFYI